MWQDIHAFLYCGTQEVTGHSSIWQPETLQILFYSISYLYIVIEVGIKHKPWLETHLFKLLK